MIDAKLNRRQHAPEDVPQCRVPAMGVFLQVADEGRLFFVRWHSRKDADKKIFDRLPVVAGLRQSVDEVAFSIQKEAAAWFNTERATLAASL